MVTLVIFMENLKLVKIKDKDLILKGISFDNEHTCYNNYNNIEDVLIGLITSATNYGIYYKDEFIGIISIYNQYYKDLTRLELSICIKKEYRNKKIGKYCFDYVISESFKNPNNKSIHLSIREDNIKSIMLAKKCGFKLYRGYKSCDNFIDLNGNKIHQEQYLLKRKDYIKK